MAGKAVPTRHERMVTQLARINETLARTAWEMNHMSSYEPGSKTAEWQAMCDKARELADKAIKRAPNREDEIEGIYDRYCDKAADYINEGIRIDSMCPSVLVSGAGNFPVKKKQKQIGAWDRHYASYEWFEKTERKLATIGTEREQIKSGDADAVEKLEAKIAKMEANQERMKAANKAIRLKDTAKGDEKLREQGWTDEQIEELREPDFCGRVGFPDYALKNNNAEIRRLKKRLEELKAAKEAPAEERQAVICGEECTVVEDADDMRLRIFFDGKPSGECRDMLKSNGFRWAPSQGAWQRQLTANARYALNRIAS